jgi:poly(beta-D-mannuronate) C5 epimerase
MTKFRIIPLFLIVLGLLLLLPTHNSAASICAAQNIDWNTATNSIEISGNVQCTLTDILALGGSSLPLYLVDAEQKIWYLAANLFMVDGAQLHITGGENGDVNELRLMSTNTEIENEFVVLGPRSGLLEIRNTKIYSFDPATLDYDYDVTNGRANIQALSYIDKGIVYESTMNIYASDIGYLGYLAGESYGLSWKVKEPAEMLDIVNVYGTVEDTVIHHNYYGAYSFGAEAMVWRNNEFRNNIQYGLDPHDDSDYLLIEGNHAHHNGNHGIICSKRCNNLTIRNNVANFNVGHGIMLHEQVNDSVVEYNETAFNTIAGIALFNSHRNIVRYNTIENNTIGIRVNAASSFNVIHDNNILDSIDSGFYFYPGTTEPTIVNPRPQHNEIVNNTVLNSGNYGLKLNGTDYTTIRNNTIENSSKGIYIFEATPEGNTLTTNTLTNNADYGIRLVGTVQSTVSGNTISSSRVAIDLATSTDTTITANTVSSSRYGIRLSLASHNNLLMDNVLDGSNAAVDIESSNENVLRGNQFPIQQNGYIDVRAASSNTRIEDTAAAAIRIGDAESTVQIVDTEGYLLHASNNLPNQIQEGVVYVNLEFVDSSRITVIRRLNITINTTGTFTFTPTIWNAENFNIIAWEIEATAGSAGNFTIAALENGSEYNLLVNGANRDNFVVSEAGTITFDYPDIQNNIFALVRVSSSENG